MTDLTPMTVTVTLQVPAGEQHAAHALRLVQSALEHNALLTGAYMSAVAGTPARHGDATDAWLRSRRDDFHAGTVSWLALDYALDAYRQLASAGRTVESDTDPALETP
jgi:hypothetical protein